MWGEYRGGRLDGPTAGNGGMACIKPKVIISNHHARFEAGI